MRLEPSAVEIMSLALEVQVGGTPGAPGASRLLPAAMGEIRVVAHTAIDEDGGAGSVAGDIGDEDHCHAGDLAGIAHPAHRDLAVEVGEAGRIAPHRLVDRGLDGTR